MAERPTGNTGKAAGKTGGTARPAASKPPTKAVKAAPPPADDEEDDVPAKAPSKAPSKSGGTAKKNPSSSASPVGKKTGPIKPPAGRSGSKTALRKGRDNESDAGDSQEGPRGGSKISTPGMGLTGKVVLGIVIACLLVVGFSIAASYATVPVGARSMVDDFGALQVNQLAMDAKVFVERAVNKPSGEMAAELGKLQVAREQSPPKQVDELTPKEFTEGLERGKKLRADWVAEVRKEAANHLKSMTTFKDGNTVVNAEILLQAVIVATKLVPQGETQPVMAFPERGMQYYTDGEITYRFNNETTAIDVISCSYFNQPTLLYKTAVFSGPDGKDKAGEVLLFYSKRAVDNASMNIVMWVSLAGGIGLIGGIGVAFVIAAKISGPARALLDDIKIIARGNLKHQTRARSQDEIGVLAQTINAMTQSLAGAQKTEEQAKAREHELNIASEIQATLLPKSIPKLKGYEIAAFYRPSKEVGGDYYDFIEIDDQNMGVVVADVSGKGIPGSMVMTMARAVIRGEATRTLSPKEAFIKANRVISRDIKRGMFVTACYYVLHMATRTLTVLSAGHNPLVIWRAREQKVVEINPKGIALGFDRGPIFERTIQEEKVQLYPGDRIINYTDGIPEAMSPKSEEFGEERFYKLVEKTTDKTCNQFCSILVQAIEKWAAGGEQHDDITIVAMSVS